MLQSCTCSLVIALLTLASHSLLCKCSWSTWDICMKVGGKKIWSWYNSLSLFVVCVGTATSRAQSLLLQKPRNKAAGDLEESSSFSSCPKRILVPVLSLTFI